MSIKALFAAALLVGVVAALTWERIAITKLHRQNESLQAAKEEADHLAAENSGPSDLSAPAEAENASLDERSELLRLRNEIRQLRAQKKEVEKLQAENDRVAAEIKSGKFGPGKLQEMEGYVAREAWTNASVATPDATIQTFFGAISTANLDELVKCMTPENGLRFQLAMQRDPEGFRKEFFGEANPFRKLNGFRIAERTTEDENNLRLGIQAAAGGEIMPLHLRRIGQEWKITDL